jgi:hypothetical protein
VSFSSRFPPSAKLTAVTIDATPQASQAGRHGTAFFGFPADRPATETGETGSARSLQFQSSRSVPFVFRHRRCE